MTARGSGKFTGSARSFYNGSAADRFLVSCPDCGKPADIQFGDHGGECIASARFATPQNALGVLRRFALDHQRFSINDLRPALDKVGVPKASRSAAIGTATRRNWIEADGTVPSSDPATKRHRVQVYKSLIYGTRAKADQR